MDCDLYVKRNANPTRFDFDYRDISFNQVTPFSLSLSWNFILSPSLPFSSSLFLSLSSFHPFVSFQLSLLRSISRLTSKLLPGHLDCDSVG
jgi:hypothetical protein